MRRPIILRTSERRDWGGCEWRWYKTWREGLRQVGPPAPALWFGSLVHEALADWYLPGFKRGPHPAETFERLAGEDTQYMKISNMLGDGAASITEEQLVDATKLGIAMLDGYVRHWGRDERWKVLQPEKTFQLDVPHPTKPGKMLGVYAGTYDLVLEDQYDGDLWLGEHKTAKAILLDHLPLDPQAGGYLAVAALDLNKAGMIKKGQRLRGIRYNFLRKAFEDERPKNALGQSTNKPIKSHYIEAITADGTAADEKMTLAVLSDLATTLGLTVLGDVSKNQAKPLFVREDVRRTARERQSQITRIQAELLRMAPIREGKLEPLKNPTRDCGWCNHFNLCLLDEQGGDTQSYIDAAYTIQDPYADHRKTTEGDD